MDTKYEKYLPIGSIVLLKEATQKVMITGYLQRSLETGNKTWDYVGCMYPTGSINPESDLLFNHDGIDKVYFLGYSDDEQKKYSKWIRTVNSVLEGTYFEKIESKTEKQADINSKNSLETSSQTKEENDDSEFTVDFSDQPIETFKPVFPSFVNFFQSKAGSDKNL